MKKFTKIAVVFAVIFAILGIICVIVSFALGLTWGKVSDMVEQGKFDFAVGTNDFHIGEKDGSVMIVDGTFSNLDIEVGAGVLEVVYADVDKVEVQQDDVHGFKQYVKDHTLHIEGGAKIGVNSTGGTIIVRIPKDMRFDEVDLGLGAGEAKFTGLIANSVDLEIGTGEARLVGLDTKELNADTDVGNLYVELVGSETDYSYDAECGVGEIEIGTTSVSGLGGSKETHNPSANRYLDLECGMGHIHIAFENKKL